MARYIIDASSLNDLQDNYPKDIPIFEPIYNKVFEMFDNGKLFSVREVYEELKDSQEFWDDYKHCFRELTENETKNVSDILCSSKFKVFVEKGMNGNGDYWTDPHLIACAMESSDIVVITQESRTNKPEGKIPYVCREKGIRSINLLEFIKEINE